MSELIDRIEQRQVDALIVFDRIERALNLVLPGSDFHSRYKDVGEVGLAMVIGRVNHLSYNPVERPDLVPLFEIDNQDEHPGAWGEIAPEFLEGNTTDLGRFSFFALAKTENMRVTGWNSSYDPARLAIKPGQVGFAGGRRIGGAYFTPSGLWEVHDHLVSGAYALEISSVVTLDKTPYSTDYFAEQFQKGFAMIQKIHEGVAAEDIDHKDIGEILPLVDNLPYTN